MKDTCSKTAFMYDGVIYEQIDGVSMGAALGPVLANIIMTEMERVVVDQLIQSGKIKFYARYVDDTLLLVKPEDIDDILQRFNRFHKNIEFTVDRFDDCVPHFLDLEIHHDGISIYRKDTHTAQFMHFDSFTKWNHKVAWIKSLTSRGKWLCSHNKLSEEIKNIKRFASFNGFPRWTVNKIVKETLSNQRHQNRTEEQDQEVVHSLYMFLPYAGREAEQVVMRCKKRLAKLFKKEVKVIFKIQFQATKLSFYTSNKDRIPLFSNSSLVYRFTCPGCSKSYIGKTETTLFVRTRQHGWSDKKSAVYKHFENCPHWNKLSIYFGSMVETSTRWTSKSTRFGITQRLSDDPTTGSNSHSWSLSASRITHQNWTLASNLAKSYLCLDDVKTIWRQLRKRKPLQSLYITVNL